ncbi:MAG: cytochrome b N-terminal domain-containing protein [Planctomycetes bacterium]|nr:cytochrome b N-terminal domain-containing protein [Planctomycetota bacterium]
MSSSDGRGSGQGGEFLATLWSLLRTPIPPGRRGFLALGWPLLLLFLLQVASGILLSFYYQPSPGEAAESTRRILRDVDGGWLVFGVHHWSGQAMVALSLLQPLRVLLTRAWRGAAAGSWTLGVLLLPLVVLLAYSGSLLKWDVGAHATVVAALSAVGEIPWIGPSVAYMVRGGEEVSATTLSRLHSAHTQFLPWFVFVLVTFNLVILARRRRLGRGGSR